jgi:protein-disulfide isomerase
MDKRFLGILAAIAIVFVGIFAISQHSSSNSGSNNSGAQTTKHIQGQGQKGVTLQEWGDYQCPVCEDWYLPLKQVTSQFSNDIYFQFSNLPLTAIHTNAFAGARAAEAAGLQNKYWEMHDKLYENQNSWDQSTSPLDAFSQYAQQIGLNVSKFKQDYASSQVNDAINGDLAAFDKTGKDKSTPTLYLNGKYLDNSQFTNPHIDPAKTASELTNVIKAEIAKKQPSSQQ